MNNGKSYNTKQRDCILNYFEKNRDKCFSAKDIINNNSIKAGEATIYRCLLKLAEEGRIKKFINEKGEGAYYQYNSGECCNKHFHLKCLKCGQTVHMDCSLMTDMERHIENEHDFIIDNGKTVLYGICKSCK